MAYLYWSDLHFGHKNIITYCNRPFESVGEMDMVLANAWRQAFVDYEDPQLICLGDVTLWNRTKIERAQSQAVRHLVVPKAYLLVMGNHDSQACHVAGLYDHLFDRVVGNPKRIHEIDAATFIYDEGELVCLSHAPMRPEYLLGGVNVYGHIHDGWVTQPERMIEQYPWLLDSTQHFNASVEHTGYRPVTLQELKAMQYERGHP